MADNLRSQTKLSRLSKNKNLRRFIIGGFFFVLAGGVLYLIFLSPMFKIDKIIIQGNKEIKEGQIREIIEPILAKKIFNKISTANLVFLPDNKIKNAILNNFPIIKEATLKKNFSEHNLTVNIAERQPAAIWCRVLVPPSLQVSSSTAQQINEELLDALPIESCFFVDEQGFVFRQAPIFSGGPIATVYDQTIQSIKIKDNVANEKTLAFILAAKKELRAINLNLTDFVIQFQSLGDLEILTPENWRIYLNINDSVSDQISALKRVLAEEIKGKRSQLEYVDLRVANKVYYKLKQ